MQNEFQRLSSIFETLKPHFRVFTVRSPIISLPSCSNTSPTHANDALNRRRQIIQSFAWQVIITSCRSSAKRSDFPTVTRVICISLWEFEQPRKSATGPNRSSTFRSQSRMWNAKWRMIVIYTKIDQCYPRQCLSTLLGWAVLKK